MLLRLTPNSHSGAADHFVKDDFTLDHNTRLLSTQLGTGGGGGGGLVPATVFATTALAGGANVLLADYGNGDGFAGDDVGENSDYVNFMITDARNDIEPPYFDSAPDTAGRAGEARGIYRDIGGVATFLGLSLDSAGNGNQFRVRIERNPDTIAYFESVEAVGDILYYGPNDGTGVFESGSPDVTVDTAYWHDVNAGQNPASGDTTFRTTADAIPDNAIAIDGVEFIVRLNQAGRDSTNTNFVSNEIFVESLTIDSELIITQDFTTAGGWTMTLTSAPVLASGIYRFNAIFSAPTGGISTFGDINQDNDIYLLTFDLQGPGSSGSGVIVTTTLTVDALAEVTNKFPQIARGDYVIIKG